MEGVQLSDFFYNRTFMSNVRSKMEMGLSGAYSMVAIDIEHFRLFNKLYGRETGDELILYIQNCLKEIAGEHDGVIWGQIILEYLYRILMRLLNRFRNRL